MSGRIIDDTFQEVEAATSGGLITVTTTANLYSKARAWLSMTAKDSQEIEIVKIVSGTTIEVRFVRTLGQGPNYGLDDVSDYAPEIRLNYTGAAGTGIVTGGTSGETANVASSTATYLVITAPSGPFTDTEALTFTAGGPAVAVGTQATVKARIDMPEQFVFNRNDKPLD